MGGRGHLVVQHSLPHQTPTPRDPVSAPTQERSRAINCDGHGDTPPPPDARTARPTHQSLHSARVQLAKTPRRAAGEDSVKKSRATSTSIGSTFLPNHDSIRVQFFCAQPYSLRRGNGL